MIATILSVIAALPKIIGAITALVGFLEKRLGPNWAEALQGLTEAHDKWELAKTPKEEADAVRAMARALSRKS